MCHLSSCTSVCSRAQSQPPTSPTILPGRPLRSAQLYSLPHVTAQTHRQPKNKCASHVSTLESQLHTAHTGTPSFLQTDTPQAQRCVARHVCHMSAYTQKTVGSARAVGFPLVPRRALPVVTTVGTTYLLAFFGSVGLKRKGGLSLGRGPGPCLTGYKNEVAASLSHVVEVP